MIRQRIQDAIDKELPGVSFSVDRPRDMAHGDYATNAALVGKVDPHELAAKLKVEGVEKIEVLGKFINFFLTREELLPKEQKIPQINAGKKIMVEYTDPNPFKEFHIGHLMSNAIGESIARLFEVSGADVSRANYQGDVGPHVAKAIQILLEREVVDPTLSDLSSAYVEGSKRYEEDIAGKVEIDKLNQLIYDQLENITNDKVFSLYKKGKDLSLRHFEEIYKILGTKFDVYFFESKTGPIGKKIVLENIAPLEVQEKNYEKIKRTEGIFRKSLGAVVFDGEVYNPKLHTRVFLTSQNLPTYETKDLGLIKLKSDLGVFDKSITITANEQNDYFEVVLEAARHLLELKSFAEKTQHVSHGMMRFAQGKMSSRKGNVITGESLLEDLKEEAKTKMQRRELPDADKVSEQVAVGAIKYAVLRQGSGKDIIFDPEKSLSLEGDSGPYLQYAHTRALSLIRAAKEAGIEASDVDVPKEPTNLERVLIHFSSVVERAAKELEPHYVTTYLTELASAFNSWYVSERVIGGPHPQYGLLLASAVEQTLAHGLHLLGIPAPEKM